MRTLVATVLLVGCAAPTDEAPWLADVDDEVAAAADPAELAAGIQRALDVAMTLHAQPVFDAYAAALAARDDGCPMYADAYEDGVDAHQWFGGCTTDEGSAFEGYAGLQEAGDESEWVRTMYASSAIATADGHTFVGAGNAYLGGGRNAEAEYAYSGVFGSFSWDGPEADGTWMAGGADLDLQLLWQRAEWGNAVQLSGTVTTDAGDIVHFDGTTLLDVACIGEPAGTISVRGVDGWYDVSFDMNLEDPLASRGCDGCGTAWYRGEEAGEICVDAAALATFTEDPW